MLRAMPTSHREAIIDLAGRLRARFGQRLRDIRLFGSWARGHGSSDSDLDVAVVVGKLSHDEWRAAICDAADVELAHDVVIGPYVVSTDHFDTLNSSQMRRESCARTAGSTKPEAHAGVRGLASAARVGFPAASSSPNRFFQV